MFKIGDKVKVVGLTKNGDNPEYLKTLGMTGLIIGKAFAYEWRVAFQDPVNDWFAYDEEQLTKEGDQPMPSKFKIGDTVKVTASQEELQAINATHCFEKEGVVLRIEPITFQFQYQIPNAGVGMAFLNYAHAELVKEKTEPKFKNGDLVRQKGDSFVYEVDHYERNPRTSQNEVIFFKQIDKYNDEKRLFSNTEDSLKLVTELKVGDRVALPPSIVEIISVEEYKKKDYLYGVKTSNGVQQNLASELMPKGTCAVPEKFSVGEVVLYKDKAYEGVGEIQSDDGSINCRYLIKIAPGHNREFSGNELTKIPQDMFPELRAILKEK